MSPSASTRPASLFPLLVLRLRGGGDVRSRKEEEQGGWSVTIVGNINRIIHRSEF